MPRGIKDRAAMLYFQVDLSSFRLKNPASPHPRFAAGVRLAE